MLRAAMIGLGRMGHPMARSLLRAADALITSVAATLRHTTLEVAA
jgi:3-hydroxyisobutyrate dehydrogenase-like beta-hydroxyacid dehydrogenase